MGMRSLDDSREGIARFLARNPDTCFLAEEADVLVGAILCGHDGRRGFIYHTCVDKRCRDKGIGRALVERALTALRDQGIHKAALVCFQKNELGNRFWASMGWELRQDLNYWNLSLNDENENEEMK